MATSIQMWRKCANFATSIKNIRCTWGLRGCASVGSPGESFSQQFQKAADAKRDYNGAHCRTSENDPFNHKMRHEGLFFTIPDSDLNQYYSNLHPRFKQILKALNENALIVRKPVLEIKQFIENANYNFPVIRYVLYGNYGCGKSTSMYHLMHMCGKQDWVIAHVPWAAAYNRHFVGDVQPSGYKTGRIDLPRESAEWLAYFKQINGQKLVDLDIRLGKKYVWTKREISDVGSPMLEAIEFGLGRPKYANDIVGLVVRELKEKASEKKFKLLFAVDGVNSFWQPTLIKREENRQFKYEPEELTLVHNFKKLLSNDWTNGAVLCTVDKVAQLDLNHNDSDHPRYLLGESGFAHLDPFIPVEVSPYSNKEIHNAIEYLIEMRWFQNPKVISGEAKDELIFLCQNNPWELIKISGMW